MISNDKANKLKTILILDDDISEEEQKQLDKFLIIEKQNLKQIKIDYEKNKQSSKEFYKCLKNLHSEIKEDSDKIHPEALTSEYICSKCGKMAGYDHGDCYLLCGCGGKSLWIDDGRGGYPKYEFDAKPILRHKK